MNISKVTENTHQLSINCEDIYFEGIWPIPHGVSINSYIVQGEKTALIDGVCGWDGAPESLYKMLESLSIDVNTLDYLIVNHMEPDHSGWIESLRRIRKDLKIYCSAKASDLLSAFFGWTENIETVSDGDTLDLGNGHLLAFASIPNVHWPDTIATFDMKTGTLFSCDAFGSYGSVSNRNYDDLMTEEELLFYEREAVRYYSNIVASFTQPVKKAIEKVKQLPVKIIAPGHGIVWRKDIQRIIKDYEYYANCQSSPVNPEITLIWGSMYGMTEKAVSHVRNILEREKIRYYIHQLPHSNIGEILTSCWTSSGVILGMPTYEYKMFPPMAAVLDELGKKKVFNRKAFRFGSFGWSGGAEKELTEIMERNKMNWEFLPSVEFRGIADLKSLEAIEHGVMELIHKIKS